MASIPFSYDTDSKPKFNFNIISIGKVLNGLSSTIKTVYLHSLVQFFLYVFDRKLVLTIHLLELGNNLQMKNLRQLKVLNLCALLVAVVLHDRFKLCQRELFLCRKQKNFGRFDSQRGQSLLLCYLQEPLIKQKRYSVLFRFLSV